MNEYVSGISTELYVVLCVFSDKFAQNWKLVVSLLSFSFVAFFWSSSHRKYTKIFNTKIIWIPFETNTFSVLIKIFLFLFSFFVSFLILGFISVFDKSSFNWNFEFFYFFIFYNQNNMIIMWSILVMFSVLIFKRNFKRWMMWNGCE